MKLPWRQTTGTTGPAESHAVDPSADTTQPCPTLGRALAAVFKIERPQVLDFGPMCGDSVVYLADRGAKVRVEELVFPPAEAPADADDAPPRRAFRIDLEDESFDLILAWEHCDYVPPERLDEFGAELHRLLRPGGWLLLFSLNRAPGEGGSGERPSRYRIVGDDRVSREPTNEAVRRRWHYPTRRIEQAVAPLSIQTLHLQRTQMREFLCLKPAGRPVS